MAKLCGGMDFQAGPAVKLSPPPDHLACEQLRLSCGGVPCVKVGQSVRVGQPIQQTPATLISPIQATVDAFYPWQDAQGHAWVDVVLAPQHEAVATAWEVDPPDEVDRPAWREALCDTGPWLQPELGPDLAEQLASGRPMDQVICVGLDAFPPYRDRSSLVQSFSADVVLGTKIWAQILGSPRATLEVDPVTAGQGDLRRLCRGFGVHLRSHAGSYPCADPTILLHRHSGGRLKLPHGADPASLGIGLLTPWSAIRLARWQTRRKLDLVQPMLLAWPRCGQTLTPRFAFPGQALATLDPALAGRADELVNRVVLGNPMTGQAPQSPRLPRPPQSPTDSHQALEPTLQPSEHLITILPGISPSAPSRCISCSWCVDVCPTRLRPIHLLQQLDAHDPAARIPLDHCIDCGLCSHVCPSSIPIAQQLRAHRESAGDSVESVGEPGEPGEPGGARGAGGPPWIGGAHHKTRIDLHWLTLTTLLWSVGVLHLGTVALTGVALTTLATLGSHSLCRGVLNKTIRRPQTRRISPYALWTGMLLGLCLPVTLSPSLAITAGLLLGGANHLVGRTHRVRVHPVAWVLVLLWGMSSLLGTDPPALPTNPQQVIWTQRQAVLAQPSRLRYLLSSGQLAPFEKLSLGAVPSSVGVTSPMLLILLGLYLMYLRLASFRSASLAMASALAVVLLWPIHLTGVGWSPQAWVLVSFGPAGAITFVSYLLFASPLCLVVFLLAPATAPMSRRGRTVYALLTGSLTMTCLLALGQPQAAMLAPMVVGLLSRPLDALHGTS